MKKFLSQGALAMALLVLAVSLSGCGGGSVVSDSSSNPSGSNPSGSNPSGSKSSGGATGAQPGPSPTVGTSGGSTTAAQQATPSPTMNPVIKEAQAKPGVPVAVPESMRRPLNAQEMEKALQAMPPEVRARIQGMRAAPPGVVPGQPQATPKK